MEHIKIDNINQVNLSDLTYARLNMRYGTGRGWTEKRNGEKRDIYRHGVATELGDIEGAKEYINSELVVEDFKEGEYSVSGIWVKLYKKEMAQIRGCMEEDISDSEVLDMYPVPYDIDFRMH